MKHVLITLLLIAPAVARAAEPAATVKVANGRADFLLGEELVSSYHFAAEVAKPYFWPLHAPGQIVVTRGWPMVKGLPKETTDHVHQKSAWFCHGDVIPEGVTVVPSSDKRVKGVDFWSESKGHGRIVCVKADSFNQSGLVTQNEWRDSAGTKILDETRTITLLPVTGGRLLVINVEFHASVCPIAFGDTKEGSMGVRVSDEMCLSAKNEKNRMVNAEGKNGEKEAWGMLSAWCDYSGDVGGKHAGIAIFDSPANASKAAWHARGYGLMAANPFGRRESGFPGRKGQDDLVKLAKDGRLKLRYGIYLHGGNATEGKVAEAYEAFTKIE